MPRWVTVLAVLALLVALSLAVVLLTGGHHGPGRHVPAAVVGLLGEPRLGDSA